MEAYLKKAILVLHCPSLMHCWFTTLVYPCNSLEKLIFINHQQKYTKENNNFFLFSIRSVTHVTEIFKISLLLSYQPVKISLEKCTLPVWQLLLLKSTGVPEVPCHFCQSFVNEWYPVLSQNQLNSDFKEMGQAFAQSKIKEV